MRFLHQLNLYIGKSISWLTLFMVLLTCVVVILRYGFNIGWIAMQESISYMHAAVFMLGIAYTFRNNGHVRVDIFYQKMSAKNQALIDLVGHIAFLVPMCLYILYSSYDYVSNSWAILEQSRETGGLPFVYLLKTLIPLMAILLLLEALSQALINLSTLKEKS